MVWPLSRRRHGITLLEVLVVIGVILILMALVMAAVQKGRSAAANLSCSARIRQIGIALSGYHDRHNCFPAIVAGTENDPTGQSSAHCYSPFARMLPDLGQPSLYDMVNFSWTPFDSRALWANQTVMMTRVSLFVCPEDSQKSEGYANGGYRFSIGPTAIYSPGSPESKSGPFTVHVNYTTANFTDGLANTIGFAERLLGNWTTDRFSYGDYVYEGSEVFDRDADEAVAACETAASTLPHNSRSGDTWFMSGFHYTTYNHCATPNAPVRDCTPSRGTDFGAGLVNPFLYGVFTARSNHPGGVNVGMMDGSVHFVSDAIDLGVWRALSTRAGGEPAKL